MTALPLEQKRIAVLLAEVGADRMALAGHATHVRTALASAPWQPGDPLLSVVAVALHHYYGGAEAIFERIAKAFEGAPDRGPRWHADLLERMALDLPRVRPAVIGREAHTALVELLGFRHFFRHAYAVAFHPAKLERRALDLAVADAALARDLDRFLAIVAEALASA